MQDYKKMWDNLDIPSGDSDPSALVGNRDHLKKASELVKKVSEDLEMVPELVCLRSAVANARSLLKAELEELSFRPVVAYDVDVYRVKKLLGEIEPEFVLGSNIERHASAALNIPFVVRLVNPISQYRLIDRGYLGYQGMLNIIESIQNAQLDRYRSRKHLYKARW